MNPNLVEILKTSLDVAKDMNQQQRMLAELMDQLVNRQQRTDAAVTILFLMVSVLCFGVAVLGWRLNKR